MILKSLEKSLQVIDVLDKNREGLTLSQLTEYLGYPSSTIHHILSTFRPHDYVAQDPETKKYTLGFKFLSISGRMLENLDVRKASHNYLLDLSQKCNETVHLSILRNGRVTYIDKIQKEGGLSLATYIGFSTDPHAAAGGKVLLSEISLNKIEAAYRNRSFKVYGKNTITNMAMLHEELDNIKKQGYALDNEEYYEGVRCVAAPIRAGGKIVAAISVTGSIFTMTMERINLEIIEMVTQTAKEISLKLKW